MKMSSSTWRWQRFRHDENCSPVFWTSSFHSYNSTWDNIGYNIMVPLILHGLWAFPAIILFSCIFATVRQLYACTSTSLEIFFQPPFSYFILFLLQFSSAMTHPFSSNFINQNNFCIDWPFHNDRFSKRWFQQHEPDSNFQRVFEVGCEVLNKLACTRREIGRIHDGRKM